MQPTCSRLQGRRGGYVSKWEAISEVVRELKSLAINRDIPIVASVQFNRNQKNKGNKELDLGDIAGSDSIPQDASIVLGIQKGNAPFEEVTRVVEVMKNREGMTPKMATAFTFAPVDFSEIPLVEEGDEADDTYDTSWMS